MNSWRIISATLSETANVLGNLWMQGLPPRDCPPSGAQEALCDEWCRELARNIRKTIHPPADVQPWVLARLVAMAEKAAELHRSGMTGPPPLTESTLRVFLIEEWHKRLSRAWKRTRELPSVAA
jgi:hypothetical protein